ncbi:MAG: PQQ-binding-like beta-propeller repeat protein [Limisphaerales bacterium]
MRSLTCALAFALLPVAAAVAVVAPSGPAWPEFRGPHRSGTAPGARIPAVFGPATNVVWQIATPPGPSSPVVWGDHLVLTAFESERLVTLAVNRRNGSVLWRAELEPGSIESGSRLSHPASATPCTDGDRWIAYFAPFGLVAYDRSGAELWRLPLPTPVTGHGASSSPVLAGDLVLQQLDQDTDSSLIAVDKLSGRIRWRAPRPEFRRGFSTPLPWPSKEPTIAVVAGTLQLVAYGLADGAEQWRVSGLPNEMVSSPLDAGGLLMVAGWTPGSGVPRMPVWSALLDRGDANQDGLLTREEIPSGPARQHFHYIDADRDGRLSRSEYETIARIFDASRNAAIAVRPGGSGDITETHVAWSQSRGLPYVPTPLSLDGRIFMIRNGGLASCLDARTGDFLFQEERIGALGDYYASPVGADGRVLFVSHPGRAVVIRATDSLDVLSRNDLGEEVLATPALADSTVYIRGRDSLFAFREPVGE